MIDALEGKELEDLSPETRELADLDRVNKDHLKDRLEGRDGGLRPSKPKANGDTGLEQYVWRMARFHSGDDPRMPVTAGFHLDNFLENEGIDASVGGIRDETGKEIEGLLEIVAGGRGGARREPVGWVRTLGKGDLRLAHTFKQSSGRKAVTNHE